MERKAYKIDKNPPIYELVDRIIMLQWKLDGADISNEIYAIILNGRI